MNCHGNHENNGKNESGGGHSHKGHSMHMLLMVLCCALPIVLLVLFPLLRINNTALRRILPYTMMFLCPLMHILMIPMMFRKDKNKGKQEVNYTINRIEAGKEEA